MKISAISFDAEQEQLLAKVVQWCRNRGTLNRTIKMALIHEESIEAVFSDTNSSEQDRLNAIALVQASINAQQRLIDIHLLSITGNASSLPPPSARIPELAITREGSDEYVEIIDNY
jgi:hypothetical protein